VKALEIEKGVSRTPAGGVARDHGLDIGADSDADLGIVPERHVDRCEA
jgi:hypothetical protein